MTYFEKLKLVVETTINLTKENSPDLLQNVVELTDHFATHATESYPTLNGMVGLIHWSEDHPEHKKELLTTLIHDLAEFQRHRFEKWYYPRSYDFAQFVKE